jgi:hypothetical protein
MRTFYYTIEKEIDENDGDETLTGNKTISLYEIIDNIPKPITSIYCGNEDNSKVLVNNYLIENDYSKPYKIVYL